MICLACLKPITAKNRQTFKAGLRLPYCSNCIGQYLASKNIASLNQAQRTLYVDQCKKKLHGKKVTREQVIEAKAEMQRIGLTSVEVEKILEGIVYK